MLARLPGARAKEIIRALERAGFVAEPQKATSHLLLRHPLTKRTTSVPIHSAELPRWLLKKIIKDAGLDQEQLRSLL
jgi:predicted RNA binding protein YcfA (HicA-like mRNA interferase family)